ncbi:hypothetical protein [Thermosporothrix hazakensis]|nr:hypothetical protein [Thermosporothrix hazakensis]
MKQNKNRSSDQILLATLNQNWVKNFTQDRDAVINKSAHLLGEMSGSRK